MIEHLGRCDGEPEQLSHAPGEVWQASTVAGDDQTLDRGTTALPDVELDRVAYLFDECRPLVREHPLGLGFIPPGNAARAGAEADPPLHLLGIRRLHVQLGHEGAREVVAPAGQQPDERRHTALSHHDLRHRGADVDQGLTRVAERRLQAEGRPHETERLQVDRRERQLCALCDALERIDDVPLHGDDEDRPLRLTFRRQEGLLGHEVEHGVLDRHGECVFDVERERLGELVVLELGYLHLTDDRTPAGDTQHDALPGDLRLLPQRGEHIGEPILVHDVSALDGAAWKRQLGKRLERPPGPRDVNHRCAYTGSTDVETDRDRQGMNSARTRAPLVPACSAHRRGREASVMPGGGREQFRNEQRENLSRAGFWAFQIRPR